MKTDKRTFVFHLDWTDILNGQPDDIRLAVFDAIIEYVKSGNEPEQETPVYLAFQFIKYQIDKDAEKYAEVCDKRANAGRNHKGNQYSNRNKAEQNETNGTNVPIVPKMEQMEQNGTNGTDNDYEYDNDIINTNSDYNTNSNSKISCSIESVYGGENENADKSAMRTQSDTPSIEKSASPKKEKSCAKKEKEPKHEYGEYKNVLLTDSDAKKLRDEYGDDAVGIVQNYSEYKEMKGYKCKNDYLAIRKWGADAYYEQLNKHKSRNNGNNKIDFDRICELSDAMLNYERQ